MGNIYSLLLPILFLLPIGLVRQADNPVIRAAFCNLPGESVKVSDFKNCAGVTMLMDADITEKYKDLKVIGYTFVHSPKAGKTPPFVEEVIGTMLTESAHARISGATPGDLVILTNIKVWSSNGSLEVKGAMYQIIPE